MTVIDVRTTRPRFRLRRRAHKVTLTAHILGSVGWFGVALLVAFCGIGAAVTTDPGLSVALMRTVETVPWISIQFGLVAVGTGVVLSLGTKWGLVRHWWVVAKIVIAVLVIVTDALVIRTAAHEALASGNAGDGLIDPTIAHTVVLAVATVLSVFKPRGRTPWTRADPR